MQSSRIADNKMNSTKLQTIC